MYNVVNINGVLMVSFLKQMFFFLFLLVWVSVQSVRGEESCPLSGPHLEEGLHPLWAQEYTGADLLREKLERSENWQVSEHLYQVLDTSFKLHGEHVSQLIAGPHPSAAIPRESPFNYINIFMLGGKTTTYDRFMRCRLDDTCPSYINISMGFPDFDISAIVALIEKQGTTAVFAAGNFGDFMSSKKRKFAEKQQVVAVGNCGIDGNPYETSSFSPEVAVCAPSGMSLRTYSFAGNPNKFGGTSGAAALVSSALIAFTAITGYPLNPRESTEILKKTAIPHPRLPAYGNMGRGMVNIWKIGEVAFKLQDICQSDRNCYARSLRLETTFRFPMNKQMLLERASEIFPVCMGTKREGGSLLEKQVLLKELRKTALLDLEDWRLWKLIACINREERCLEAHEKFYDGLANRAGKTDEEVVGELLEDREYLFFLKYIPWSHRVVQEFFEKFPVLPGIDEKIFQEIKNSFSKT